MSVQARSKCIRNRGGNVSGHSTIDKDEAVWCVCPIAQSPGARYNGKTLQQKGKGALLATFKQEDPEIVPPQRSESALSPLRWTQILAISIFAFAFNFHWAALGTIILPSQVLKMVGDQDKGTALAFVLVPEPLSPYSPILYLVG